MKIGDRVKIIASGDKYNGKIGTLEGPIAIGSPTAWWVRLDSGITDYFETALELQTNSLIKKNLINDLL